ncbi:MAG: hypothetical protein JXM72_12775 [Deltaproteobacteria bacterium]|nr:hypothetical protein [Deltaproteobacteria bacterium]
MNLKDEKLEIGNEREILTATFEPFLAQARRHLNNPAEGAGLENARDKLVNIIVSFDEKKEEINSDMDLVAIAKLRKVQEAEKSALEKIDAIKDQSIRLQRIETRVFAPAEKQSDSQLLLAELRQAEIRRHFEDLDEVSLNPIILVAIENGDAELVNALLNSPVQLFSQAALQEFRKDWGIRRLGKEHPELMSELADLELINGLIQGMRNTAKDLIRV